MRHTPGQRKTEQKRAAALADQYFTRPEIARQCLDQFVALLDPAITERAFWVEPSAGNGAFLRPLLEWGWNTWAGDIHPQHERVVIHDYLAQRLPTAKPGQRVIVVGNPPFGKKAKLATSFVNRALQHGGLVGMIVPIQLRKWSAQQHVNKRARLVLDIDLPEDAFLFLGEPYSLRCCFQVWTTWKPGFLAGEDRRLTHAPRRQHPDFDAWQYNCTQQTRRYFEYDWDFAILRQGYGDFSVLHPPEQRDRLDPRKQWIFVKAKTPEALERLRRVDFVKLSRRNTGVPGFGKADLVEAYIRGD